VQDFDPQKDDKEIILKNILGTSGNLRVPTLQLKKTFIVGFNENLYEKILK